MHSTCAPSGSDAPIQFLRVPLTTVVSMHVTIMWGRDINPSVPGWGTGPDENQKPRVYGVALYWNLIFFYVLVPG